MSSQVKKAKGKRLAAEVVEVVPDLSLIKDEKMSDEDESDFQRSERNQIHNELIQKTMASLERPKDEFSGFGEFVAHELRCINSLELRKKLKRVIQKTILEVAAEEDKH